MLILAGMAIYGYLASSIVELIAHGVLTGTMAERRRRRMIERISDHYIICGYGRVGRQVAGEFRDAGVPFVVLDFNPEVLEIAREHGVPYIEGSGTKDEDLEAAGLERARGLVASLRLGRRQPLHHRLRAVGAAGPARSSRGPRPRTRRSKMLPRRRRPGRAAVRDGRPGDGEADAEAAGVGVPRHRLAARRPRPPLRGDRDHARVPAGGADDPRDCGSATRPAR